MQLSLHQTVIAIAEAMLAGEPYRDSVAARAASILGAQLPWLSEAADDAVHRFGHRWDDTQPDEVAPFIADLPGFVSSWMSEERLSVIRILRRAPVQRRLPPPLAQIEIPQLPALGDLADWLELSPADLGWLANRWRVGARDGPSPLHHYSYRVCEKRGGRYRLIERPKSLLRAAQHKLLHGLLDRVPPHEAAHGFRKGRNIVSFAAPHVGQPLVIRLDLADFFVSVTEARVHSVFRTLGYTSAVARAMTAMVTNRVPSAQLLAPDLKGKFDWLEQQRFRTRHLPQGASTSPALANLCAFRLDTRLAALARSLNANYTRYADDLAFSGGAQLMSVADRLPVKVAAIAIEEGFSVQPRKTRVMPRGVRQQLAGIVVNQHPNFSRDKFDTLKATLNNCVKHGVASQNRSAHRDFRASLAGHIAHVTMLNSARGAKLKAIFDCIDWSEPVGDEHGTSAL
ncbi:reverse transcriptase [Paraburkholderia acidicola]|uniref:RNA-directed DNA polymerase n=1 Tax=Paraburkholderia acidicola TaxID=1912599 RepID=A0A2A4EQF3_9BURK|nr:reverse transcriptase [Paraburkholderia acidicola]